MSTAKQNVCAPGVGFLFTPDGLSLKDMAAKLHEEGYLTNEEMVEDGGVPALCRKLYDTPCQNRQHYSTHHQLAAELTGDEKKEKAREEAHCAHWDRERDAGVHASHQDSTQPGVVRRLLQARGHQPVGFPSQPAGTTTMPR